MAKRRMNKDIREKIVASVLASTIDVDIEAHEKAKAGIGRALYREVVSEEMQAAMEALPEGCVASMSSFLLPRYRCCFPNGVTFEIGESVPRPASLGFTEIGFDDYYYKRFGGALDMVRVWYKDARGLRDQREDDAAKLMGDLKQFRYVEDLIEAVPAVEPHVPEAVVPRQFPVCVSHLKSVLGANHES